MDQLQLKNLTLTWLKGGIVHLDGGAMFGVVPKPLWSKRYPANENNQVKHVNDPIYFEINCKKVIVDSGIGNEKLTEKQKRNFGCTEESRIEASLKELGTNPEEIDYVLMTHLHFDHACGLTKLAGDQFVSTFPKAQIITSRKEWNEMRNPNIRSQNTYWRKNWEAISEQVVTFEKSLEVLPGLTIVHTGGHSDGHSIVVIEKEGEKCIHMGDLLPTHAHRSSLWVTAYDDYPMDSIYIKEKWVKESMQEEAWFIFYHDAFYRAIKWNKDGEIISSVKSSIET
ncbi:MAG: beta-lactamase superfamily domain protein [Clostridiales bacterium]|jgi:glyoxylase-like metal-dependent hydrolase (beta-lactamase superfamily II)|nr:beta-lactamase superfamily domain protein [Clostridiales bacterium]